MDKYTIIAADTKGLFQQRLDSLNAKVRCYIDEEARMGRKLTYAKVFLSDAQNQQDTLLCSCPEALSFAQNPSITTIVEQAPQDGSKISVLLKTSDEEAPGCFVAMRLTEEEAKGKSSYDQTMMLFERYIAAIGELGLTLEDHCVRTWIYVGDIDNNYAGVVKARNDVFAKHGLTPDTHFIASTGIGGRTDVRSACVAIDFLTYPTVKAEDIHYLNALDHLNPTHEYGVAFERGTRVTLPDGKQQFFVSGTASIDHKGQVMHVGNIEKQTERLLENIDALLKNGGATINDMQYFIIYLRDNSDYHTVDSYMEEHFPQTPRIIVNGSVCRPQWLVEMEGVAIR